MEKLIIAAFVSLVSIGTASADSYSDLGHDQANLTNLPATAADRPTQTNSSNIQNSSENLFPGSDQR